MGKYEKNDWTKYKSKKPDKTVAKLMRQGYSPTMGYLGVSPRTAVKEAELLQDIGYLSKISRAHDDIFNRKRYDVWYKRKSIAGKLKKLM